MNTNSRLKKSHNATQDKAAAYLELLRLAGTSDCIRLMAPLRDTMDESTEAVDSATRNRTDAKALKQAFKDADEKLKSVVAGTYAIIEGRDEELFAKLPEQANWSKLAGVQQAEHLIRALESAGKAGKRFIADIQVVERRRAAAEKAWVSAGSKATAMHTGETAVAKLKSLIAQADVILRPLAPPGSPLFELLKEARAGGKKRSTSSGKPADGEKKASDKTQPKAPEQQAGGSSTGESATPGPAPAPAQTGPTSEIVMVSASGAAPTVVNGVHT